jgi:hypothetical protein
MQYAHRAHAASSCLFPDFSIVKYRLPLPMLKISPIADLTMETPYRRGAALRLIQSRVGTKDVYKSDCKIARSTCPLQKYAVASGTIY